MFTFIRTMLAAGFIFAQISVVVAEEEPVGIDTEPTAMEEPSTLTVGTVDAPEAPNAADQTETNSDVAAVSPTLHQGQTPLPFQGRAMYYNPGIMETVLVNRLRFGTVDICVECIGFVAMLRAGDLNRRVWIQLPDATVHGPFHVIDAADERHVPMLIEKGWAIDVDYETAQRWGMRNPWTVTVLSEPPANVDPASLSMADPEFQFDIYRGEKLAYSNQSSAYFGHIEELYIR